ncbi:MAG: FliI/YscN family ATPase [Terracidiphilus sp.]|jgi:flagellum-specific ATP synthase
MKISLLAPYLHALQAGSTLRWKGRVNQVVGNLIESEGPFGFVGESCEILGTGDKSYAAEIVGFRGTTILSMTADQPQGIRLGDQIVAWGARPSIRVGAGLLGRVIDPAGNPLDGKGDYRATHAVTIDGSAPLPLERVPIREPLGCGIKAIDGFLTCGRGQRVGILGGSGVGKSTLIGMMARGTAADMTVLALVGERGREVGEFLEVLGEEGLRRSVVIVSTSDQSPLLRIRAALAATAVSEYFASLGKNVLLIADSLTRFAMAQREIGLAAGEPPTAKGYTPSVLNMLARLVERAGNFSQGSITAFYTVLMEGDDQLDPVVDTVRSLLDGHIVLDRDLAMRSHYPPISIIESLSRLMSSMVSKEHLAKASALRLSLAAYARSEDLIRIGAYQKNNDPILDSAIQNLPALNQFLQQKPDDLSKFEQVVEQLMALPG